MPPDANNNLPEDQNLPNYDDIIASQVEELGSQKKIIEGLQSKLTGTERVLGQMREIFAPGEKKPKSAQKIDEMAELDRLLDQAALEDQRRGGKGLPLTTKIGKTVADFARDAIQRQTALENELSEVKKRLETESNPAYRDFQKTLNGAETFVEDALEALYPGDEHKDVKGYQASAVMDLVKKEIREMVENNEIDNIKKLKNPKVVRNMVNHFMAQILPPKVREMMDNERIANTPDTEEGLLSELKEIQEKFKKAETKKEQEQYSRMAKAVRGKYFSLKLANGKRK